VTRVLSFAVMSGVKELRKQLKTTEGPVLKEELKVKYSPLLTNPNKVLTSTQSMRRVLRKLGHSSGEGMLLPKVRTHLFAMIWLNLL
jgi:hypothetical protein